MANPTFLNAATQSTASSTTGTLTAFTASAGSNRFIEVWVCLGTAAALADPTSVKWNGVDLTQRGARIDFNTNFSYSKWYLHENSWAAANGGNIVAAFASSHDNISIFAQAVKDVDSASPYRNGSQTTVAATATGGGTLDVTVNTTSGDLVTAGIWQFTNGNPITITISAGSLGVATGPVDGNSESGACAYRTSSGATQTITFASLEPNAGARASIMADALVGAVSTPNSDQSDFRFFNDDGMLAS